MCDTSLRRKRFRAVSEKGTRNESQRTRISRAAKTENPVPRSFFAPKLNENAFFSKYNSNGQNNQFCRSNELEQGHQKKVICLQKGNEMNGFRFKQNQTLQASVAHSHSNLP